MSSFRARRPAGPASAQRGFTLVELMVTLVVLGVVMISLMAVMYGTIRSKTATTNQLESVQAVRAGLDMLTRDLRSAGYGADLDYAPLPQPSIAYIDSTQVLINANLQPFPDDAAHTAPLAYDPAGAPRPFPLNGTPYAPPIRYRSGAELIRWTLDVNNDGVVDADDLSAPDGADAGHSPNPSDFVLVRQVYGDSTGNVAGANGGASERIALVNKPGAGVPAMFTVYFKGSATPWSWANGPVPASQLSQISRISVQLTASSPRRNQDGTYARTTMRTEVASSRNVPDFGYTLYPVDGYVFNDKNQNLVKDFGEPGISNAFLLLGKNLTAYTDANGHYVIKARPGSYRLKHVAPSGYGILTSPDSTMITLANGGATYSFADTAKTGGVVHVRVFRDLNGDGYRDLGEPGEPYIQVTGTPGPDVEFTDVNGEASVFAQVGAFTVTLAPPDSMLTTTPNPVAGIMMNGDTASVAFGVRPTPLGTVAGKVFRDVNKNGVLDAGEQGMPSVWVGVTRDAGTTVSGYAMTDGNGEYTIRTPVNDPPRTTSYSVFITPPSGYYATTSTALAPVWVNESTPVTDRNFGVLAFQLISLEAARVLSLANGDLAERDWPGSQTQSRVRDLDLVLGSDSNGADQVSVWLNHYDSNPLFNTSPDYNRSATGGVLALAVDTLDAGPNLGRERGDVVTGTDGASARENFHVWLTQSSSGNEGYLPAAPTRSFQTKDKGDVYAVLTGDLSGASSAPDGVDILVGTSSRSSGHGTIELWRNTNAATPDWKQIEIYPNTGSFPSKALGEVTSMALADFDGDGLRDLVVTARTLGSSYSGQLIFMKNQGRTASPVFLYTSGYALNTDLPTSVAVADVDADGRPDVVVGTRTSVTLGSLLYWRNTVASAFSFTQVTRVVAPGIVASVAAADFGGDARPDIAVGYRTSSTGFGGGVRIFYSDLGNLTGTGVDPTGGSVVNFVPAITTGNFNYGVYPSAPFGPYLTDMAIGVKTSDVTGALVVVIR